MERGRIMPQKKNEQFMLRLTKDCCRSRRTVVEKRDEEVFLVTQSQIFVTSPICRPNANRYRYLYRNISVLVKIVLF